MLYVCIYVNINANTESKTLQGSIKKLFIMMLK
jgi:hypothetical protein